MNILLTLALGTVVVLIPGALLGEISKAILLAAPSLTWLNAIILILPAAVLVIAGPSSPHRWAWACRSPGCPPGS